MKKLLVFALVAVMALTMFTACGSNDASSSDNGTDTKVFKVGFDAEYPPYTYKDENGEFTGFDIEMAQKVCEKLGWEIELVPIDWDSKDMELKSGAIDCIWSGFTMNGLEDKYAWTVPYVDNSQVILTRGDKGIKSLADLKGKKVGVQAASAAFKLLVGDKKELSDTFAELVQFNSYNTSFMELEAGSIDAIAVDIGVAQYQVASRPDGEYVVLDEILNTEVYGIGFRTEDTELRDQVQEAYLGLVADGTYEELAKKYELTDFINLQNDSESNAEDEEDK